MPARERRSRASAGFYSKRCGYAGEARGPVSRTCRPDVNRCWISHRSRGEGRRLAKRLQALREAHLAEKTGAEALGVVVDTDLKVQRQGASLCARGLPVGDSVGVSRGGPIIPDYLELCNRTHRSSLADIAVHPANPVPEDPPNGPPPNGSDHASDAFLSR